MSKPHDRNADCTVQTEATTAIFKMAKEAGLHVLVVGTEDFDTMIEHTRSHNIAFTQQDCEDFKEALADALNECWVHEAKYAFDNILESKETK